jgi:hypothetical protein
MIDRPAQQRQRTPADSAYPPSQFRMGAMHHGPNDRIETGAISAARQDSDGFARVTVLGQPVQGFPRLRRYFLRPGGKSAWLSIRTTIGLRGTHQTGRILV